MNKNQTKLLGALFLGFFFGCAPAVGHSKPVPTPDRTPNLCDLDGGRWCTSCGHPGEIDCPPQKDEGWLCCANGACIAVTLSGDCTSGVVGWCSNYSLEQVGSSTIAICHDGQ